jgi:small redox-active disulfide protein 2
MNIKVLGSGCSNCKRLFEAAKEANEELNCEAKIEYITELEKMMEYGMMSSPGLVINEVLVSQGRVLTKKDIIKLIETNEVLESQEHRCTCGGNC